MPSPSFLPQFDYEVFLSYGWADNGNPALGDRAWIREFKRIFERDVSDTLPHGIRVYLDIEHSQNGAVPENLEAALRSSAIFLLVLTESSCRRGSWCRWELSRFLKHSLNPIARDRKQIFSIRIRDVDREKWPRGLNPYCFGAHEDGRFKQFEKTDLIDRNTPGGGLLHKVAYDVAQELKQINVAIQESEYLAETSQSANDKLAEVQRETRKKLRLSLPVYPLRKQSEQRFASLVRHCLRWSCRSVHLVDDEYDTKIVGWSSSVQEIQLRLARERFSGCPGKLMTIWRSPGAKKPTISFLADSFENANICENTPLQDLQTFLEELRGNGASLQVLQSLQEKLAAIEKMYVLDSQGSRVVYLECVEEDKAVIEKLEPYFAKKGVQLCSPIFDGPRLIRNKYNRQNVQHSHGVVVYYGSFKRWKTAIACDNVTAALGERAQLVAKAVLLHPTDDTDWRTFFYPHFQRHFWDDHEHPPQELLDFIELVREVTP